MKKFTLLGILFFGFLILIKAQTLQQDLSDKIDITVAKDGSGDFTTIQAAINAVANYSGSRTLIYIKKGIYNEKVSVPSSKQKVTLLGEDVQETILTFWEPTGIGNAVLVVQANDFWLMNITVENKQGTAYAGPQAVALKNKDGDRNIIYHSKLFSFQDTWFTDTEYRTYAKDCFVEGSVDYIFGPSVSVFDSCVLFCNRSTGAVITAANTNGDDLSAPYNKYGYVFFNCKVFSLPTWRKVHNLGRPWRQKASVIYYKCDYGDFIKSDPWNQMSDNVPEEAFFYEYNCTGSTAVERDGYMLPYEMAVALSKTDTGAINAEPCFDSIFNPNVIPSKRGHFSSGWNPEKSLQNDSDSVLFYLKKYTTKYMDDNNYNDARITKLQYNDIKIDIDPDSDVRTYAVENVTEIDTNQCFYPVFEYPGPGYIATRPKTIPGMGKITTVAKDKTTSEEYNIYFNKDGAFTNANVEMITIDTVEMPGFSPDIYEYHYNLEDYMQDIYDNGHFVRVKIQGYASGAKIDYNYNRLKQMPDTISYTITAPDGITTNTYTVYVTWSLSVENIENTEFNVKCINPIENNVECIIYSPESTEVQFMLFDASGTLVRKEDAVSLLSGTNTIKINASDLKSGMYFYAIKTDSKVFSGKILKNKI